MKSPIFALPFLLTLSAIALPGWAQESTTSGVKQVQTATGPVTVAWGQPEQSPSIEKYRAQIASLDRNEDGSLSSDELPTGHELKEKFKLVDQNHDGGLSAEELANWY
ncbi:MAG: EF-hand domain-containing protein [Pseudoxanthomonas sp.]